VWGRDRVPAGPLEDARAASAAIQTKHIKLKVSANTTIVGLGGHAVLKHLNLHVDKVDNVIIRNLTFVDAADCFPQWDPTDGSLGNWNSAFDNVSVIGTTHVWVDHSSFTDGPNPDSDQPLIFGRPLQVHDGELDITKAADLVTVEWNAFLEHDKTMLIGSSDNSPADVGKLRVTVHHNVFNDIGQRAPRVRFGQVHVYNNLYQVPNTADYVYTWGVGIQSQTFAQNNFFQATAGVAPDQFITVFKGTAIHAEGTLVNGLTPSGQVDVVAEYNAAHDPDLGTDVGWTPTLFKRIDPTVVVPFRVGMFAGADRL